MWGECGGAVGDALQLLIPSDEADCSSDTIHLPWLNLNLPGCSMSNSLRTAAIRQANSKLFFSLFLRSNKGGSKVQPVKRQKIRRTLSTPRLARVLYEASPLSTVVRKRADVDT